MLTAAQARLREGADVVVGVVETHGRAETEALLDGLEIMPRRDIDIPRPCADEMDLDALLARRPELALVDELAHTNAPGSRHPKRYMDVEELLAAGIDVYTTLNVQHIESLNDVIAQITRIRVRETVPDSIIDQADDIELVDLTPDDLIQRLKDGKVYVPHAGRARHPALFLARQSDRAARTGAAAHRPTRRRANGPLHAQPMPSRVPGPPGSACWSASTASPTATEACVTPAHGRPAERAMGRHPCRNRPHRAAERSRAGPRRRNAASGANGSVRKP